MKYSFTILVILFLTNFVNSQIVSPKFEMRSIWVASVTNIDWPTSKFLSPAQQRNEFITLLDRHKLNKVNALFAQVRPTCDAFYQSPYEPWSEWLTGTQGTAPNPLYDPLTFMVEEAHKRGIELHAWINPYRAVLNKNSSSVHSSHISKTKPQWVKEYGVYKWLDPGNPEVMEYVTKIIMDIVRRYDIDGIHFDDYFYPYPQSGQVFQDDSTFILYPRGFTNKNDWRRNNVNMLVKMVNDSIKSVKKHVKFGISPFGIWRNNSTDPLGSATTGFQSYDEVFADSRKWVQESWLDYINPQIYWNIGFPPARFEVLSAWWNSNAYNRQVFVGHAAYKIGNGSQDTTWLNPTQMPNQIRMIRGLDKTTGSVFFSSKSITGNLLGVQDSLRNNLYKYPALIPPMKWLDSITPMPPSNAELEKFSNYVKLNWITPSPAADNELPYKYVVYKYPNPLSPDSVCINPTTSKDILAILPKDSLGYTHFTTVDSTNPYVYLVTSIDRLGNESCPVMIPVFPVVSVDDTRVVPNIFSLSSFPNPFNPATTVSVTVNSPQNVSIVVYNTLGDKITELAALQYLQPGVHHFNFDGSALPSGVYFIQAVSQQSVKTIKLMLLK